MIAVLIAIGIAGSVVGIVVWRVRSKPKPDFVIRGVRIYAGAARDWMALHRSEMGAAIDRTVAWWSICHRGEEGRIDKHVSKASIRLTGQLPGARGETLYREVRLWWPTPFERERYLTGFPDEDWETIWWRVVRHEVGHLCLYALGYQTGKHHHRMQLDRFPDA